MPVEPPIPTETPAPDPGVAPTAPPPEYPVPQTEPGQPTAPPPEIDVPGPDIDIPSPMPGGDPGVTPVPGQPVMEGTQA